MSPCPIPFSDLVDYRFGDEASDRTAELEEHLFECPTCSRRAELLLALQDGVAERVKGGELSSGATLELLRHAEASGMTLRSYRIEPGGSVDCTAAPDDDLVVVRLAIDAPAATAVDVETEVTFRQTGEQSSRVFRDVSLDQRASEVVYVFPGRFVRSLPRSTWVMQARVVEPGGERLLGPYRMEHTPWDERHS